MAAGAIACVISLVLYVLAILDERGGAGGVLSAPTCRKLQTIFGASAIVALCLSIALGLAGVR